MSYAIKNRFNESTVFESQTAIDAKSCIIEVIKNDTDLCDADLAGADLRNADLRDADLAGADLAGADLRNADLRNADLGSADLRGANLSGADLGDQWIIQGGIRSDGYAFFLQHLKDETEPMVKAGCRYFTIPKAFEHWNKTRGGTPLSQETIVIINAMIETMHIRGLK